MTTARHRVVALAAAGPSEGPGLKGKAPRGMWWVAWRQRRAQIAVSLALIMLLIVALVIFREKVIAAFAAAGRDPTEPCTDTVGKIDPWFDDGLWYWRNLLHSAVVVGPVVLGVFVGAPIFTREFARGTHVFALTQSVRRRRWWTTTVTVAGVPLMAGLAALGFVTGWVDGVTSCSGQSGLIVGNFMVSGIMPAAHGLVSLAAGVAAGIVTRSTIAALASGLVVSGLIVAGMAVIQPHTLPASRQVTPMEQQVAGAPPPDLGPGSWLVGGGYLDADGNETSGDPSPCFDAASRAASRAVVADGASSTEIGPEVRASSEYQSAYQQEFLDCAHSQGVFALYTDYLPGSVLWPLRWAMTGIAAIIAALFLLLSATRLRAAAAKR